MSTVAVVGRPCTTRSRISSSQEPVDCRGSLAPSSNVQTQLTASAGAAASTDADAMVAGRQIDLARAVALAEFHQPAGAIDAQALDRVARPAAAVAFDREPLLGPEHAVVAPGRDVTLEIGLAAEQAKAVLHLPLDARLRARRLRERGRVRDERKQKGREAQNGKTQDGSTHDGCGQRVDWGAIDSMDRAAEM